MVDFGILIIRVVTGLVLAAHGSQKLFGWFGGGGIAGTRKMMRSLNVHPSIIWAWISGISEFAGGSLVALGFLMPLGALMLFASMWVALVRVHWGKGFWNSKGGYEWPLVLLVNALGLGFAGPGVYSIDALIHFAPPEPLTMIIGIILALIDFMLALVSGRVFEYTQQEAGQKSPS